MQPRKIKPFISLYHSFIRVCYIGGGGHGPPLFCVAEWKKWNKEKKEIVSKQKLLKGCHQSQNVTVLVILECLKFKTLSCWSTMVSGNTFQCSIAPSLWNQFCRSVTTQKTVNNRNISPSRSDNCNSKVSINVEFEKDNHLDFQYFRKSARNSRSKCRI